MSTILTNTLGGFAPDATVTWAGYAQPAYALLSSLDREVNGQRFASLAEARDHLSNSGWQVEAKKTHFGVDMLACRHIETAAAADAATAKANDKWAKAKPCFVRYGKLPEGGRSFNFRDGRYEDGVSVFRGERLPSGEARAIVSRNDELGTLLCCKAADATLYIVVGTEIGSGSDGEPVLSGARIVRKARV